MDSPARCDDPAATEFVKAAFWPRQAAPASCVSEASGFSAAFETRQAVVCFSTAASAEPEAEEFVAAANVCILVVRTAE